MTEPLPRTVEQLAAERTGAIVTALEEAMPELTASGVTVEDRRRFTAALSDVLDRVWVDGAKTAMEEVARVIEAGL